MINGIFIVGITGKAGAGKDTLAHMVMDGEGERMEATSFAKALRNVAEAMFGTRIETQEEKASTFRNGMTGRQILQAIGDGMRKLLGETVWVDALVDAIGRIEDGTKVVIVTDVRYPNEAAICDLVVRIQRDALILNGAEAQHRSETAMDAIKPDWIILNTGTLDDLRKEANSLKERLSDDFI